MAKNTELEKLGAVKDVIHAFLASVSFADANLGRILDALDASPENENTIIVVGAIMAFIMERNLDGININSGSAPQMYHSSGQARVSPKG